MILGRIELNSFYYIRLILEAKFGKRSPSCLKPTLEKPK